MYVRHLGLRDFRSWANVELELTPGRTVFVGSNGFGKTNLVEALWYSSTLGSHRVATDAPLIRVGAQRAVVSTIVVNEGRECAVDLEITAGRANNELTAKLEEMRKSVETAERKFRVDNIQGPWDIAARLREVFGFLQENLKGTEVDVRISGVIARLVAISVLPCDARCGAK